MELDPADAAIAASRLLELLIVFAEEEVVAAAGETIEFVRMLALALETCGVTLADIAFD